ncbi:oxidoreductase [Paenibacillus sp. WLX1005]|uniref:oxidoreductase n=1 Tax=Paenibacillus sp. WLX1005 TaxID=3243766 RepID=UPI003983F6C2
MSKINRIETRRSKCYQDWEVKPEGQINTNFSDILIDGISIYDMLKKYEFIPCFGWGVQENQQQMVDYFLLNDMHPYLYWRYPLLVCAWCGDEECGFISVFVEREGNLVIWQDFRLEADNRSIPLGPFTFEWEEYEQAIRNTCIEGKSK